MKSEKKVLLVDFDDPRRKTRVGILKGAGYDVETRADHEVSEALNREGTFDLLILALHHEKLEEAVAYSERLRKKKTNSPDSASSGYGRIRAAWHTQPKRRNWIPR